MFQIRIPFLLILMSLTGFNRLNSQTNADIPLRVEIPARSPNETYRVIPAGPKGLVLFYKSVEAVVDSGVNWYFTCYDTNLQQIWVKAVPLPNVLEYKHHQLKDDTLSVLFTHSGKVKETGNRFAILRLVPSTGTFLLNLGKVNDNDEIASFKIEKGRAWIGINEKGRAGRILNLTLRTGRENTFSLGQGGSLMVRWMQPDTTSAATEAIVSRQVSKKSTEYYFVRYDTTGVIKQEVLIGTQQGEQYLNHFAIVPVMGGSGRLLLGTYGNGGSSSNRRNIINDESTGFFAALIQNSQLKNLKFINFLELSCAGSLIGEHDVAVIKEKASKKNKSLNEYALDYSILLHDILLWNDQYLLLAETFTPQFRTESFTDFDYYGRPYTNTYSVFEGYRFFNGILAGFDSAGNLLWDNSIEIRNLLSVDLNRKVTVIQSDSNDLVLCYGSDGKVASKIINQGRIIESLDFSPIDLAYNSDKLLAETKSGLSHWYDDYFIFSGYQEIKNISLGQNSKRFVFYFSKLKFER